MIVFNPTSPFTFKCIPQYYNSGIITLFLRDELKNITTNIDIDSVAYQNFILYVTFSDFTMIEGQSFEVTVKENDVITYIGKAYATSQTDLENYQMNKGILKV
jgi:hypothetical protein